LPHGPIEKLSDNLWWVWGSLRGMSLKRAMTIVRLNDGGLVLHNAVALEEPAMKELESLGSPAFLIVPSASHRLDAPAFKRRYPALRVFAPAGSRAKVAEVLQVDGTYDDFPANDTVRFETLNGVKALEGAMIVTSADGVSLVLNDAVFNMDRKRDPLGFFFTTLLGSAPGPRVSRLAKLALISDKKALRQDLLRLAELPNLVRLVVAHEKVAHGTEAAQALRTAAGYL
jgi:hypothetical protein